MNLFESYFVVTRGHEELPAGLIHDAFRDEELADGVVRPANKLKAIRE